MHLTVLSLVKDEEHRFWRSALSAWSEFADQIIVVDDGSDDRTSEIAFDAGAIVFDRDDADNAAWGEETPARSLAFGIALRDVPAGGYILVLDADMVPARSPRPLLDLEPDSVAFPLFDLWAERDGALFYRDDALWCAHDRPRIWLFRRPEAPPRDGWEWSGRGIHSGHLPVNFDAGHVLVAPPDFGLLHYAYLTEPLREAKHAAYLSERAQLHPHELEHARSILDDDPSLSPLPYEPELTLHLSPHRERDERGAEPPPRSPSERDLAGRSG